MGLLASSKVAGGQGEGYIFHRHPAQQRTPDKRRLRAWYVSMLARVRAELAGYDYKVLFSTRCFKQTGALIDRRVRA